MHVDDRILCLFMFSSCLDFELDEEVLNSFFVVVDIGRWNVGVVVVDDMGVILSGG